MSGLAITASTLTKRYGRATAVDGLSFTARPGAITGFLGPNGAGKSTTLRMLLGLTTPSSGTITIGGRRLVELDSPSRTVGALLDARSVHPQRSGYDHLLAYATAALGTLACSTASALAALVVALLLVPAVGGAFGDWFSRYWPVTAGQSVYAVVRTDGNVAPWLGFAVLAVAVAAVGAAATIALRIRDH